MQCPECGGRGRVTGSINHGSTILRYRRCPICNHRWKAWEEVDAAPVRAYESTKQIPRDDLFAKIEKKDARK